MTTLNRPRTCGEDTTNSSGALFPERLCHCRISKAPANINRGGVVASPRGAHMKTCPDCNGDGVVEKGTDDEQQCPTCGGRGFVPDDDDGQEEVINTRQPN